MKVNKVCKFIDTGNEHYYFVGQYEGNLLKEVSMIEYHEPKGDGDRHYCDVGFKCGRVLRIFNPDSVEF